VKFKASHIVRLLSMAALLWSICITPACKKKKQEIPPFGDVHLQVLDENKQPVDTAIAYLYTSPVAFAKAFNDAQNFVYTGEGSVATVNVINGKVSFTNLPSDMDYWVLAHGTGGTFIDNGLVTTIPIDKDNADAFYFIPKFTNGTQTTAIINLRTVSALIQFNNAPSTVSVANVNKKSVAVSEISGTGNYIRVRNGGNIPYYIRTNDKVWIGEVNAEVGEIVKADLGIAPNLVATTFSTISSNITGTDNIEIYLGQNRNDTKPIAILTAANLIQTVYLAPGTNYSYFAVHSSKKCVWQKEITLGADNPLLVCN
jgi:hypothetical protein